LRGASETLAEDSRSSRVACIKRIDRIIHINRIKPGESPRADQANP
jgi:hypothetical protein